MIPSDKPASTNSRAERELYDSLKALDDKFVVIHSFPWLNSAITKIDARKALIGETDFIILHPDLGILAIEVKGGNFKTQYGRFIYTRTGASFDPFTQLQRGVFTLDNYIKKAGLNIRVGQAFVFPDVVIPIENAPAIIKDTKGFRIYIDASDTGKITSRIIEIMTFWRTGLPSAGLSQENIDKLVNLIAPTGTNLITWEVLIKNDRYRWLALTPQQSMVLNRALDNDRVVIHGRPGTGKTLIAIEIAKRKSLEGKKVLFITFNRPLVDEKLKIELKETSADVMTFHQLCSRASTKFKRQIPLDDDHTGRQWYHEIGPNDLIRAINKSILGHYDVLIIDEAQTFRLDWLYALKNWISHIYIFCDASQSFNFEYKTLPHEIEDLIKVEYAGALTATIRTLREIHERLEVAIPDEIQQVSLRDYEDGRIEERVGILPAIDELAKVLKELEEEGINSEHIAIVHHSSMKLELPEKLKQKVKGCYSSARVRGLEYPIIICINISPDDEAQLISAYTRATSKVIAIYSVDMLNRIDNLERYPFFRQILEKPEIISALKNSEALIMRSLGWRWSSINSNFPYKLKWIESIGMWLVEELEYHYEDIDKKIAHEIYQLFNQYLSHLTNKPATNLPLSSLLPGSSLSFRILTPTHDSYYVLPCSRCNQLALVSKPYDLVSKQFKVSKEICVHCDNPLPEAIPDLSQVKKEIDLFKNRNQASTDEKLALPPHLLAIGILESLISKYPNYKKPICYLLWSEVYMILPRLIIAQVILKKGVGSLITRDELIQRVYLWTHDEKMKNYVPRSMPMWLKQGWLEKSKRKHEFIVKLEFKDNNE